MVKFGKIDTNDIDPTMEQVNAAILKNPDLARKYASQIPYLNTVSIRNQLRECAWEIILDGNQEDTSSLDTHFESEKQEVINTLGYCPSPITISVSSDMEA